MMLTYMKIIVFVFCSSLCIGKQMKNVPMNTEDDPNPLLTEKELKLIRYLSYLTYLQTNASDMTWNGWEENCAGPQLDLDAIRYPLAHIGYTAAALAYRTGNSRELSLKILNDTIKRMLTIKVWGYIDQYWSKVSTFPDPVSYENIMYSGHLLQLITLYESISGDLTYDTNGFDFIWNKSGYPITKIHYTTTKLVEVIYRQMLDESSAGVSCEPGWVYTICQNHPHLGLKLYDIVRQGKTNYSSVSLKWKEFLNKYALEDVPIYKKDRYFKMLYQRETHVWVPFFASTGNDGWVLAWLSSWYDSNQTSNFVCNGWKIMYLNKYWKFSTNNSSQTTCFLDTGGYIGVRMQLNSWLATSFYPIVEKQCSVEITEKLNCTYLWFDFNFGKSLDTDNDGFYESFYYETKNFYSNWVTTNILLSSLIGQNSYQTTTFLRNIYTNRFYEKFLNNQPEVLSVQYPLIRLIKAQYYTNNKDLLINFNTEKSMIFTTQFIVKYPNSILKLFNITRDGLHSGFLFKQISNDQIQIQYSYENLHQQQTQFNISFH